LDARAHKIAQHRRCFLNAGKIMPKKSGGLRLKKAIVGFLPREKQHLSVNF
jgi:hypothetical protein